MNLGLRELVWLVVGLLGLYMAMQLGRLLGLRRARRAEAAESDSEPESELQPADIEPDLEVQHLRREVAMLREELASADSAWQEANRRLEAELLRLREGMEGMQVERSVSPDYGEAMVLARRGLAAEVIAERCGISVAEAALIRSLVQGGKHHPGEAA
jgi:uncharacterized protein DUF2802